jgi:hypothetical protein
MPWIHVLVASRVSVGPKEVVVKKGEEDFRLRRCTHEEHGFGEKIFAVEDMPSLWVYCTCERGEHVGAALVFVSGCSRLRSIRDPHGHRFHLGP